MDNKPTRRLSELHPGSTRSSDGEAQSSTMQTEIVKLFAYSVWKSSGEPHGHTRAVVSVALPVRMVASLPVRARDTTIKMGYADAGVTETWKGHQQGWLSSLAFIPLKTQLRNCLLAKW